MRNGPCLGTPSPARGSGGGGDDDETGCARQLARVLVRSLAVLLVAVGVGHYEPRHGSVRARRPTAGNALDHNCHRLPLSQMASLGRVRGLQATITLVGPSAMFYDAWARTRSSLFDPGTKRTTS